MINRIKWLTISLLVFLALFLNIEKIIIQFLGTVSIDPFVYLLGILMMLAVILNLRSMKTIWIYQTITLAVYLIYTIGTVSLHSSNGMLPEINFISYLTEIFMLIILVLLSGQFSCALGEFEQTIEDFSLSHVKSDVKSFTDILEDFHTEVYRCRRNNQPFQLVIVEPIIEALAQTREPYKTGAVNPLTEEILNYLADRYESNKTGSLLLDITRRTDIVAEQIGKNRFVLLCPSRTSPIPDPDALRQRIKKSARERLNLNLFCGVASFPDDSLILEELMEKAESQLVIEKKEFNQRQARPAEPTCNPITN